MNFLVVLKDESVERSTFIYVQLNQEKTLLHFSPEFHLEGLTLGEVYQTKGMSAILDFFGKELDLPVKEFIEISLAEWDRVTTDLFPTGLDVETEEGILHLSPTELQHQMRYRVDEEDSFSIFKRQQKILKSFLKRLSKKRNLLRTTQLLKKYPNLMQTSIQFPQILSLIHRYLQVQQLPSRKLSLPLADTFRVVKRAEEKKVIVIDFTRNRNMLHQVTMGKAN
ncbi:hypothetical protein [Candidatus Enterococcus courvalinii]|uniref:Transcriptional regulator n=1 Tax=Candidatus Enterococcus courvalinii TaxID=2815329 RepID=A0ABS3HZG6_9ENTE|nr:hypothetical protein [Enterococcus sp. MSG2901]MBO0480931.1 hypothetical protein [Enterococcus sp. MSG2901]